MRLLTGNVLFRRSYSSSNAVYRLRMCIVVPSLVTIAQSYAIYAPAFLALSLSPTVVHPVIVTSCANRGDDVDVDGLVLSARKISAEKTDSAGSKERGRLGLFNFDDLWSCTPGAVFDWTNW